MTTLVIILLIAISLLVGFGVGVDNGLRRVNDFFTDKQYLEQFRKQSTPNVNTNDFLTVAYAFQSEAQRLKFTYTIISVLVALIIAVLGFYVVRGHIQREIEYVLSGGFSRS